MGALTVLILIATARSAFSSVDSDECGTSRVSGRIVGGTDAVDGEWPWQVSLFYYNYFMCGASLISSEWVMTAAHCVMYSLQPEDYTVYLAMHKMDEANPQGVAMKIKSVIAHEEFVETFVLGDIALLQLESPIDFTENISPVCLPSNTTSFPCGLECWVTGWGATSYWGYLPPDGILQQAMTPLVDNKKCIEMYKLAEMIAEIQYDNICAGFSDGQKGPCQGDSGGALVCKVHNKWYQIGVVSWGVGCAWPGFPAVYTLTTVYQDWISSHMQVKFHDVTDIPKPTRECGGYLEDICNKPTGVPTTTTTTTKTPTTTTTTTKTPTTTTTTTPTTTTTTPTTTTTTTTPTTTTTTKAPEPTTVSHITANSTRTTSPTDGGNAITYSFLHYRWMILIPTILLLSFI